MNVFLYIAAIQNSCVKQWWQMFGYVEAVAVSLNNMPRCSEVNELHNQENFFIRFYGKSQLSKILVSKACFIWQCWGNHNLTQAQKGLNFCAMSKLYHLISCMLLKNAIIKLYSNSVTKECKNVNWKLVVDFSPSGNKYPFCILITPWNKFSMTVSHPFSNVVLYFNLFRVMQCWAFVLATSGVFLMSDLYIFFMSNTSILVLGFGAQFNTFGTKQLLSNPDICRTMLFSI